MDPFLRLANGLYDVVYANFLCLSNWGVYLFDKDFDREPELRNKIGTIWLCSLFDTLEAQQKQLPRIEEEARRNNWPTLVDAAEQMSKFCVVVGEVFDLYTRVEQIFLRDFRNHVGSLLPYRSISIDDYGQTHHGRATNR